MSSSSGNGSNWGPDENENSSEDSNKASSENTNTKPINIWTYKPNEKEQVVLDDCGRLAFRRFVPTALLLGGATILGVRAGYMKPSPKFGATPKLLLATVLSYVLSNLSVCGTCADNLKSLSDSPLGDHMRKR